MKTRGEIMCPGEVSVSCLASNTHHECPRHSELVDGKAGLCEFRQKLYGKWHMHNARGRGHHNIWVNPLTGAVLRVRYGKGNRCDDKVLKKIKKQKRCTVTETNTSVQLWPVIAPCLFLNKMDLKWRQYLMSHDVIDTTARLISILNAVFRH